MLQQLETATTVPLDNYIRRDTSTRVTLIRANKKLTMLAVKLIPHFATSIAGDTTTYYHSDRHKLGIPRTHLQLECYKHVHATDQVFMR